jgi:hypothetical protein
MARFNPAALHNLPTRSKVNPYHGPIGTQRVTSQLPSFSPPTKGGKTKANYVGGGKR